MECIICKDSGSEPLQDNIYCTCKYKFHSSCWIDYVNSKNNTTCLLCRKDISTNSIQRSQPTILTPLILATAPPYTIEDNTSDQQITYQEFVDIIHNTSHNTSQNTNINIQSITEPQIQSPKSLSTSQKVIKVIIGLSILAIIAIIFSIIMKLF
jgi:hypothetical protein